MPKLLICDMKPGAGGVSRYYGLPICVRPHHESQSQPPAAVERLGLAVFSMSLAARALPLLHDSSQC